MAEWDGIGPILESVYARLPEVQAKLRKGAQGPEWGFRRRAVQQLAGIALEILYDREGHTFREIAEMLRDEEGHPLSEERVRVLYHKLAQIDDDLRHIRGKRSVR